jgi:hypothetical protein
MYQEYRTEAKSKPKSKAGTAHRAPDEDGQGEELRALLTICSFEYGMNSKMYIA